MIQLRVLVSLKTSVFDPQGRTTLEALHGLGYKAITDLRQGKSFLRALRASPRTRLAGRPRRWRRRSSRTR